MPGRQPRTYEHRGERLTLREWAARVGVSYATLHHRLSGGDTLATALEGPRQAGARKGSRGSRREPSACVVCGRHPATSRSGRCIGCRLLRVSTSCVDMRTPYGEDRAAQAFVAEHPDGATLEQVGLALGVTRERVRQIELDALRHFRQRARVAGLPLEVVDLLARRAS